MCLCVFFSQIITEGCEMGEEEQLSSNHVVAEHIE